MQVVAAFEENKIWGSVILRPSLNDRCWTCEGRLVCVLWSVCRWPIGLHALVSPHDVSPRWFATAKMRSGASRHSQDAFGGANMTRSSASSAAPRNWLSLPQRQRCNKTFFCIATIGVVARKVRMDLVGAGQCGNVPPRHPRGHHHRHHQHEEQMRNSSSLPGRGRCGAGSGSPVVAPWAHLVHEHVDSKAFA